MLSRAESSSPPSIPALIPKKRAAWVLSYRVVGWGKFSPYARSTGSSIRATTPRQSKPPSLCRPCSPSSNHRLAQNAIAMLDMPVRMCTLSDSATVSLAMLACAVAGCLNPARGARRCCHRMAASGCRSSTNGRKAFCCRDRIQRPNH